MLVQLYASWSPLILRNLKVWSGELELPVYRQFRCLWLLGGRLEYSNHFILSEVFRVFQQCFLGEQAHRTSKLGFELGGLGSGLVCFDSIWDSAVRD